MNYFKVTPLMHSTVLLALIMSTLTPAVAQSNGALPTIDNQQLSFADAIKVALSNNADLKIAGDNVNYATAGVESADAQRQPSLSANTYDTYGDSSNIVMSAPGVSPLSIVGVEAGGRADQNLTMAIPLFTGGRLSSASLAARLSQQAALQQDKNSIFTVKEAATEQYAQAALSTELVTVAQSRVDEENEQVRVTQQNVEQGHAAPVDLERELAEQADANQQLFSTINSQTIDMVNLKQTLGLSQLSTITLSDSLDSLISSQSGPSSMSDAISLAEAGSPALTAAARGVQIAEANKNVARSAFLPQVYAVAMGDATSARSGNRVGYTVGLTASLPVYDAGERQDSIKSAQSSLQIARDTALQIRLQLDKDIAVSWLNEQDAVAELASAKVGVTAAQQAFTLADLRYNAGKSVAVERLDALVTYDRSLEALAASKMELVVAQAKVLQLTGQSPRL